MTDPSLTPRKRQKTEACIAALRGLADGNPFHREDAERVIMLALSATQLRTARNWLNFLALKGVVKTVRTDKDGTEWLALEDGSVKQ